MLQDVTGQAYAKVNLTGVEFPEQIQIARVTSAYFRLLGLPVSRVAALPKKRIGRMAAMSWFSAMDFGNCSTSVVMPGFSA